MTLRTFCVTDQQVKHKYAVRNTCLMISKLWSLKPLIYINEWSYAFLAVTLPIVQERIALSVSRKCINNASDRNDEIEKLQQKNKKLLDAGLLA